MAKVPPLVCDVTALDGRTYCNTILKISGSGKIRMMTVVSTSAWDIASEVFDMHKNGIWNEDMKAEVLKVSLSKVFSRAVDVFIYVLDKSKLFASGVSSKDVANLYRGVTNAVEYNRIGDLLRVIDEPEIQGVFNNYIHKKAYMKYNEVKRDVKRRVSSKTGSVQILILGDYKCLNCGDKVDRMDIQLKRNGRVKSVISHQMSCHTCGAIDYDESEPLYPERPVNF